MVVWVLFIYLFLKTHVKGFDKMICLKTGICWLFSEEVRYLYILLLRYSSPVFPNSSVDTEDQLNQADKPQASEAENVRNEKVISEANHCFPFSLASV